LTSVERFQPETETFIDEGCYIVELHNGAADVGCSIARARLLPRSTTRMHSLQGTIERYVIIEGTGTVRIGNTTAQTVAAMDVVTIPADIPQSITNSGEVDLIFLCICTPRFVEQHYQDLAGQGNE